MSEQLAVAEFPKASTALSLQLGLEPRVMVDALKSQFFKGKEATDAQLAVVISIAKELKLNPLLPGQLYPYPGRDGSVTVMIGPDGIYTLLSNNPDIVAQKDGGPAYYTEHGVDNGKETCTGVVNHRTKGLLKKTIWVDEWVVSSNPNWQSRRHHMAEIRALKQAARMVVHGLPADSDEHKLGEMLNVTESAQEVAPEAKSDRPAPKPRASRGAAAAKAAEVVVTEQEQEQEQVAADPVKSAPVIEVEKPIEPAKPAPDRPVETKITQRALLAADETITVEAMVEEFQIVVGKRNGTDWPYVTATIVSPELRGQVSMTDGSLGTDGKPVAAWQKDEPVRLTVRGKKYKSGALVNLVDKIEIIGGAALEAAGQDV